MDCLLGIDIGTSGTKAILVAPDGRVLGAGLAEYELLIPRPGWAEQNPSDWWEATVAATRRAMARAGAKPEDVLGIGLSGQMHGSVFLDGGSRVIRPAILWCDQRTAEQCRAITERIGAERLLALVANPALTGFTAPKILWLRENEPENYARVTKVLLPKDYVRYRLTGAFATEVSDASGTLLFDVANRRWSEEVLAALEIPRGWMPDCFESPVVSGRLSEEAAAALGLLAGTPVVGGGGDNAAGAVGNGIVRPGVISVSIGTSGVVFAHAERPIRDPEGRLHTFCHAVPGKWHLMGVTLAAGGSLRWFRDTLARPEVAEAEGRGCDPYEVITEMAASVPPGSEGLIFLPYLAVERTPYPDPYARGVFFGLSLGHTRAHMARAVLEGVAYSLNDCLQLMRAVDVPITEVRATGGGARSRLWRQIQADLFDVEMVTINATEGPAFGAALLAGVGTGVYPSVEEASAATTRRVETTRPDPGRGEIYWRQYQIYR
ncbi:MAG: xylulokinase, partial [Firmicutes bacterium]|nr:xylulokinase [Bacillota bacterium]